MTSPAAKGPSPIIFVVILASASAVSLLIIVSPYILTYHDPAAISISARLSPTEAAQNQTIKVTVSDVNGLRIPNELPLSGDWRVQNLSMGPCYAYTAFPYGVAVYQGRYALTNISSASSMAIYAPGIYNCPSESNANSFTFKPLQNASSYVELRGYWTAGETPNQYGGFSEGVLHPFLPGEYTVVAGDEWGHVDILYFQVTSSSATTSTGGVSTPGGTTNTSATTSQSTNGHNTISVSGLSLCPSDCVYPAPYASASVLINANVPISSLTVYVNNTYDGVAFQNPSTTTIACTTGAGQTCSVELGGGGSSNGTSTSITKIYATCSVPASGTSCSATYTGSVNTLSVFDYQYKGSVPSSFIPAVPGDTYVFKFVATFQDGSTATATASAVAG